MEIIKPTIADYKQRDLELYHQWKNEGSNQALGQLVKNLQPLMYSEVRRQAGTLPEAALSAEAKKWTVHALKTYDVTKGVAISTHVTNWLQKVRRLNAKYQNAARMPENLHYEWRSFNDAIANLESELNREPTEKEIAKKLGWTEGQVVRYQKGLYADLSESAQQRPTETSQFNENKLLLDHIMSQLDEQEKFLLLNKGTMPAAELAVKLGVNVSRLNYLSAKLRDKIALMRRSIGMY